MIFLKMRFLGILILHRHAVGLSRVKTRQRLRTLSVLVCPSTGADPKRRLVCVRGGKSLLCLQKKIPINQSNPKNSTDKTSVTVKEAVK